MLALGNGMYCSLPPRMFSEKESERLDGKSQGHSTGLYFFCAEIREDGAEYFSRRKGKSA